MIFGTYIKLPKLLQKTLKKNFKKDFPKLKSLEHSNKFWQIFNELLFNLMKFSRFKKQYNKIQIPSKVLRTLGNFSSWDPILPH